MKEKNLNGSEAWEQISLSQGQRQQHQNPISQTSSSKLKTGRWTTEQCRLFCKHYAKIGKNWGLIALQIPSRSAEQVRSHAQKYIARRLRKETQQKEQQEAQKQIALGETKRAARTCKNKQAYIEEDFCIKQNQSRQSRKKKSCQKSKQVSLTTIETDFRENNSLNNIQENIIPSFTYSSQKNYDRKICKSSPNILMPEPDFGYIKEPSFSPSLFYATILPFLQSGLPIPLFLNQTSKDEEKKTHEKKVSVSERIIQDQSPRKGFVSYKKTPQIDSKKTFSRKECQYSGYKNDSKMNERQMLPMYQTVENLIIDKSI